MKKLFALVLSLALVVAFAVPALATGWASLDPAPVYKEISIAVYGLETVANTSKVGKLYEELKTTYPVVEGTKLHFLVEVTVPYGKLTDATKALIAAKGLKVEIATSNMVITEVKSAKDTWYTVNADADTVNSIYTNPDYDTKTVVFDYEVWAKALSDKEAKVVATAGFYNEWESGKMEIYNAKGELAYTVYHANDVFAVVNTKGEKVRFPVVGKQIDKKGVKVYQADGTEWILTFGSQGAGSVDFYNAATDTWASKTPATYDALNKIYKDIFGFLGFEFAECEQMTEAHFTKFFRKIGDTSASYTWNAGSVIVNPATPELPQTGDNASIVGFAMVVVAMVAAAVVTFKKVRA